MKKQHYVNNKALYEAILEYKKKVKESEQKGLDKPRIPEYVGECISKIAEKLATKPCFNGYSFKDEMISDGIENCIVYFDDYDPFRTTSEGLPAGQNPFAYFTQIIYFAFIRRIGKEEKNRYIIYKNFQNTMINHDSTLLTDNDDKQVLSTSMYDNINVFMKKFETKELEKKQKRKNIKEGLSKYYGE